MLRLAGFNVLAALAFAAIYAAAGSRWLTQWAFLASLAVFFAVLTALWTRVERSRPCPRDLLSRVGRDALALVVVVVALPPVALAPLFALNEALPSEAGFAEIVRPIMVLLLLALGLVVAMNAVGVVGLVVAALCARRARRRGATP